MGVGAFVSDQQQPIFWDDATNINQEGDWIGLKIAKTINSKRLIKGNRTDLSQWLFPGMKTVKATLETRFEINID